MPTRSNPDSPFIGAQVEAALGGRVPGTPTSAGKPGPQAANFGFPAPPAPSSAPPGRPSAPTIPAPLAPTASTPGASPAPVSTPLAVGPGATPMAAGEGGGGGAPGAAPAPAVQAVQYREAMVQARTRLGPIPNIFRHPNLPEMPVELGASNYNPFTGMWS